MVYQVMPDTNGTWRVQNVETGRDVVRGITREGAMRLKNTLTRNLATRHEAMGRQTKTATTGKS